MHPTLRLAAIVLALATTIPIAATLPAQEGNPQTLRPVPFPRVQVQDSFFAQRRATNTKVTLAHALQQLEATGTLGNFDLAAAGKREGFKGYVFQDRLEEWAESPALARATAALEAAQIVADGTTVRVSLDLTTITADDAERLLTELARYVQ